MVTKHEKSVHLPNDDEKKITSDGPDTACQC
jgi:hypothetical protein